MSSFLRMISLLWAWVFVAFLLEAADSAHTHTRNPQSPALTHRVSHTTQRTYPRRKQLDGCNRQDPCYDWSNQLQNETFMLHQEAKKLAEKSLNTRRHFEGVVSQALIQSVHRANERWVTDTSIKELMKHEREQLESKLSRMAHEGEEDLEAGLDEALEQDHAGGSCSRGARKIVIVKGVEREAEPQAAAKEPAVNREPKAAPQPQIQIIPIPIPCQSQPTEQRPIIIKEEREPEEEHKTPIHERHEHEGRAHEVVAQRELAPESRIAEEAHEPSDEGIEEESSVPEVPGEEEEEEEAAETEAVKEQLQERKEEKAEAREVEKREEEKAEAREAEKRKEEKAEAREIEKEDEEHKQAEEHEEKQLEQKVQEAHEEAKEEEHGRKEKERTGKEEEERKEPAEEPAESEGEQAEPEVSEPILPPEEEEELKPSKLPIPLIPSKPKIAPEDLEPMWPPDEAPPEQPYVNPQYSPEEKEAIVKKEEEQEVKTNPWIWAYFLVAYPALVAFLLFSLAWFL